MEKNKNKKKNVPGASPSRGLIVIFGILDFICGCFFVCCVAVGAGYAATPTEPEMLPSFEENAQHYRDLSYIYKIYHVDNSVNYISAAAPETDGIQAAIPDPVDPYAGFLFPESDRVLITEEDIAARADSAELCQRAINEIYARYGYQFTKQENLDYFNQYSWYAGMIKTTDQDAITQALNITERTNVATLTNYMTAHHWG